MTVSMVIRHHDSGTYEVIPIAASGHFESHWLTRVMRPPASRQNRREMDREGAGAVDGWTHEPAN
jgi:hypothetical protein